MLRQALASERKTVSNRIRYPSNTLNIFELFTGLLEIHVYNQILNKCLQYGKDKLIVMELGPTATILAFDLGKAGYQALDIGHIDIEYEWFLKNTERKQNILGKYVNESSQKFVAYESKWLNDSSYRDSIICKIEIDE